MGNVKIKVSGYHDDVEQFLSVIDNVFALMLKSPLLENSQDKGVHCFLDLDPYALREAQKQ
jgi:hypothetical protein